MSKGAISVEKQISVLNATIARLNAQLADATAEYKEYHRLFGIERKAKRKLQAQLEAVRGLPEKWLQDSYLTVCCGLEVVKVNDMDREDCANELKVAIGDKS